MVSGVSNVKRTTNLNRSVSTRSILSSSINVNRGIVKQRQRPVEVSSENYGNAFTVEHPTNGCVGTANGLNGQQITIESGVGASTVVRVVNADNIFYDELDDTDYIDTTATTATIGTANSNITLSGTANTVQSNLIFLDGKTPTRATIIVSETNGNASYFLSGNGTASFESATAGTELTFANATTNGIAWKATGSAVISRVKVSYII